MARGQLDAAIDIYRKAISIDPVNPSRHSELALALIFSKKYAAALEQVHTMAALAPQFGEHGWVGQVLRLQGSYESALKELEQESEGDGHFTQDRILVYDGLGRRKDADTLLAAMEKTGPERLAYEIASVYSARGDIDQGLRWLRRAYENSPVDVWFARVDPDLKNLRSDPRFEAMWSELKLPR